ncbi:hypothetical protein [Klenkia brasiliensis]|uniref:Uncharacterized protein n=1 Tax=Klenkia brasiliensis TaxID=333142 RepID=A0A1G7QL06_9ACTN|nr:hypothetical protein [Klenkia brasiliensis]SDF99203.1 hypothetical protein SAMN05660324_1523 [Klenkia brasiliensis]
MPAARQPEDAADLRSWRRTGLVVGYAALLCFTAAVVVRVAVGRSTATTVLAVGAVLTAIVSAIYLQRVASDPGMAGLPTTARLRRLGSLASTSYVVALLVNAFVPDGGGPWALLPAVPGSVAVVAGVAALVLATRTRVPG